MIGEQAAPPNHVNALPANDCVVTVTTHHPVVSATRVNLVVSVTHHLLIRPREVLTFFILLAVAIRKIT